MLCEGKFYNDSGYISSPGYPDEYENNEYCEWEINVSEGRAIEIVFHDVDIEQTESKTCPFDYIEVVFYLYKKVILVTRKHVLGGFHRGNTQTGHTTCVA